jgi:hypothetical protein
LVWLFLNRFSHLCLGQTGLWFSYLCFLHSRDNRHEPPHPIFISWDGVLLTFCLVWFWTSISASWVTRIAGVRHCTWHRFVLEVGVILLCSYCYVFVRDKTSFILWLCVHAHLSICTAGIYNGTVNNFHFLRS